MYFAATWSLDHCEVFVSGAGEEFAEVGREEECREEVAEAGREDEEECREEVAEAGREDLAVVRDEEAALTAGT